MKLENSVFEVDRIRHQLAVSGELEELKASYSGQYPELDDISTAEKWGQLLRAKTPVPLIRLQRLERAVSLIRQPGKVLDIGVGWGDIVPFIQRHSIKVEYTGIDFSTAKIDELHKDYPEYRFIPTGVEQVHERFDTVLLLEVMEHIPPSRIFDLLANVKRVLTPRGRLIVSVPYREELEMNTMVCGHCGSYVNRMGHVRSYSRSLLSGELKIAGFTMLHNELMYEGYTGYMGGIKKSLRNLVRWLWNRRTYIPVKPSCQIAIFTHDQR